MKKMTTTLSLVLMASTVFAADPSENCKSQILARAPTIKVQAKQQIRGSEDLLDSQLNKNADPFIGMGKRGMDFVAQNILDAVRELQLDEKTKLTDELTQLCKNNFDFAKTLTE